MALGAQARTVIGAIVGRGILLTTIGLGLGTVLAGIAGRTMQSLLCGVGSSDPHGVRCVGGCLHDGRVPGVRVARASSRSCRPDDGVEERASEEPVILNSEFRIQNTRTDFQ